MTAQKYWQKRSEQVAQRQFDKADEYSAELRREYDRAILSIQRDIEVFYQRFADNNGIVGMAEARKLLNTGQLKEFRMTLEEFIAKAKDNANGQWTKQLENVYFRTRISCLEALKTQVRHQVEMLSASHQDGVRAALFDVYEDTYYRTIYEVHKGVGFGASFAYVNYETAKNIISQPWMGANYSQRIWNDREKLIREIETNLAQAFIRGDSIDRTAQALAKRMDVSYSNAVRLVQTETSHIAGEATAAGYKESGVVRKYQFLATLDNRTSAICQSMDGKVFELTEKQEGVNYPPLHARCRSTTVPYFGDEENPGERIARDPATRKTYNVPADMTYKEWYQQHVVDKYGQAEADILKKKAANSSSDQEQYNRYKSTLGKDIPVKSFTEFQDLKYTKVEEWSKLKGFYQYSSVNKAQNPGELLVNYKYAVLPDDKFVKYALNMEHMKGGRDKAIAFQKYLGYNKDNYKDLIRNIRENLNEYKGVPKGSNAFGEKYEVNMLIKGVNGNLARVKTGWIIKNGEKVPILTTVYVDE